MDNLSSSCVAVENSLSVFPREATPKSDPFKKSLHLAVGMFDGVHLGHQGLIRQAVEAAQSDPGSASAVYTFDPHPSRLLRPDMATELLMPLESRVEKMLQCGLDHVFVQAFTLEYARVEASRFITDLKRSFPGLTSLHVGANFRFGAKRSGNIDTLKNSAEEHGITLSVLERKVLDGDTISSSRIRTALAEGEIRLANRMLGDPYEVWGRVVSGKQIGRKMGFPTLNIEWSPEAKPRFGVYMAWLKAKNGSHVSGIANYGVRPTVSGGGEPVLELHLLESDSLPAQDVTIRIALTDFLRPEASFPSMEELRKQIASDVAAAREISLKGLDP